MKPATTIVLLLLAGALGGVIGVTLMPAAEGGADGLARLESRLAMLTQELADVRRGQDQQTQALAALQQPSGFGPTGPALVQSELEAAVEAVLARRPELLAELATSSLKELAEGEPDAPERTVDDYFALLTVEGLSQDEHQALWQQIRDAGLADDVVAAFEALAEANPHDTMLQFAVGVAYLEKLQELGNSPASGEYALMADQAFDRSLELDPDNWDARFVKGLALSFWPPIFGKQSEAISQFEILRERQAGQPYKDDHVQTYLLLGNLYQQTGKDGQAMDIWLEGFDLFPDNQELKDRITGS
jgi:tetratricopeptide (TPR) repeat protein